MPSKSTSSQSLGPAAGSPSALLADARAPLGDELPPIAQDRASTAAQLVRETAEALESALRTRSADWAWAQAAEELEAALEDAIEAHGWRGPFALFVDALRMAWHAGSARAQAGDPSATPRSLLCDELGLWRFDANGVQPVATWDGRPFAPGARLPSCTALAERLVADRELDLPLERGETILVPAASTTVATCVQAAQRAGLAPEVILAEGAPNLDGRRLASQLAAANVKVRFVYDAALPGVVPRADRVWLGTEAIGIEGFAARVGTRVLLEEAQRLEVPVQVLATTDKLVPGGGLELPAWGARDGWLLWERAPSGVRLEAQPYERVLHDLAPTLFTEDGPATAVSLSLSRLRLEPAPPCGAAPAHGTRLPADLSGARPDFERR